jgi:O-methyltransferase involved in polyketide biosynthesis
MLQVTHVPTVYKVDIDEVLVYHEEKNTKCVNESGGEGTLIFKTLVHPVCADARGDWLDPMKDAGFDPMKHAYFIAKGLCI